MTILEKKNELVKYFVKIWGNTKPQEPFSSWESSIGLKSEPFGGKAPKAVFNLALDLQPHIYYIVQQSPVVSIRRDINTLTYLSVCCAQSLQEIGHQGRASRSCSRHTAACSPRRSSRIGWVSSGTPETVSQAARSPYSIGRYLKVTVLRKALGWVWREGVVVVCDPAILDWLTNKQICKYRYISGEAPS